MSDKKDCPFCAEEIKAAAKYCRWCKNWIDKPEIEPGQVAEVTVIDGTAEEAAAADAEAQTINAEDVSEAADAITEAGRESSGGLGELIQDGRNFVQSVDPDGSKTKSILGFLSDISLKKGKKDTG